MMHVSTVYSSSTPGVFCTYFYNHARRLRLEKLLYIELPRSLEVPTDVLKPLLDPGGGFALRRFQIYNGYMYGDFNLWRK